MWLLLLELGVELSVLVGCCDLGYSCVYIFNMCWRMVILFVVKEVNFVVVFDCLFGVLFEVEN